jgi:tRNA nucleotidyltransferase (CCA-adding enzyme)
MGGSKLEALLEEVLVDIRPTKEEHEREGKMIADLEERLKSMGARPILVGSLAKDTDLRTTKDVDMFILFDPKTTRNELEESGLRIGKELFTSLGCEYEIDYAEHPYVKGTYLGYVVEVVPCYDTKKPMSAVDRTPYHTEYVKKKIAENHRMADEIRLLKQFMKGAKVYGAEAKVQGFSGYLTELLVIHYGSFVDSLKAASGWKTEVLDPGSLWEDKGALKLFFPEANLIVIDPIDETRNAAAAVSRQRMGDFIAAASAFLASPSREFFFPKPERIPERDELLSAISSRKTRLIALLFEHPKINPNTLHSQLRKTEAALIQSIRDAGFRVGKSDFWTDEISQSLILFDFSVWELPRLRHHVGPRVNQNPSDQERFKAKYAACKPYVADGRWAVETERKYTEVGALLPVLIEQRHGFGKNLREAARIDVIKGEEILGVGDDSFSCFLGRFLSALNVTG